VTTWIENPDGGRKRGPTGLVRAWIEVIVRPQRFFHNGIAPGDQSPGLVFAIVVAVVNLATRFAFSPESVPIIQGGGGQRVVSLVFTFLLVAVFITPVVLHLVAALQTVLLVPLVEERTGVSETVQVVAYATAPCALAGIPISALRLVAAIYGVILLIVGISIIHDISLPRAAVATALPALLVFGYGFLGIRAFESFAGINLEMLLAGGVPGL
jgi:hypothetical protein